MTQVEHSTKGREFKQLTAEKRAQLEILLRLKHPKTEIARHGLRCTTRLKGKTDYHIYDENGVEVNSFPLRCYYGDYKIIGQNNNVFCVQLKPGRYDYFSGDQIPDYQ